MIVHNTSYTLILSLHLFQPLEGSLRTGGVFHGIASYLANNDVDVFQWENVLTLQNKAVDKNTKKEIGPSNLSSVAFILRSVAGMWTHVWRLDSLLFGSGQGRGRLWGSSFKLADLRMDENKAHTLLNELMAQFAGVEPTNPEDYLHPQSHPEVQSSLNKGTFHGLTADDFLREESGPASKRKVSIKALFESDGALPSHAGQANKRQRKMGKAGTAWEEKHAEAFSKNGLVSCPAVVFLHHF